MRTHTTKTLRHVRKDGVSLLTALLTAALAAEAAAPEGRGLAITHDGTGIHLHWNDIAEAPYHVEARTNLAQGAWGPLDTVIGTGGGALYTVPEDSSPSRFFQVLFPQPAVTAGEPALYAHGTGGSFLYVTGSFFYPGDLIRVGGILADVTAFASPSLLQGTLPPGLSPGRHDVEIINGRTGAVLAVLPAAVEVVDPAEAPHRFLYEPPQWPPAGPAEGKKGLNAGNVKRAVGGGSSTFAFSRISEIKREIETMEWKEGMGRGHVTVLKSHDQDCDGRDDDCDGAADLLLHSGEIQQQVIDLSLPGRGLDFVWTRTYRSRIGEATSQGNRWSHGYDVRCVVNPGETAAWVYDGTGRKDLFLRQADATFTCPGFLREGTLTNGIFRLTFADTGFWEFKPQGTAPAACKISRIQDRNGNAITFGYDGDLLTQITDTLGRVHMVAYTPEGRVAAITDSTGRSVTYAYYALGESGGSSGDLKSATSPPVTGTSTGNDFPLGKTVTYTYTSGLTDDRANHLLLTVTDPLGRTPLHCDYDLDPLSASFQRCLSAQRGTNAPARITYIAQAPTPANRFTARRCIFNDPEGNVSEHDFDVRNRCVALREYTGRAEPGQAVTDTENRPSGKLRADDPNLFATLWTWNNDSLCTACVLPKSNRVERVYQADLDTRTPPRQRGNLRVERRIASGDLDGDGHDDVAVFSYEHDPRFGSDRLQFQPEGSKPHKPKSWLTSNFRLGLSNGEDEDCDGRDDDCDGFITRATNPRGSLTTAEYDASGNCTKSIKQGHYAVSNFHVEVDRLYNSFGQLTAITNAPDANGYRRVDTLSYHAGGPQAGYLQSIAIDEPGVHRTTTFEYDARGNLTRRVDPRGTPTEFEVNALNQTVAKQTQGATFGERVRTVFHYDAANSLVRTDVENRDGDGTLNPTNAWFTTRYEYDALHRLTRLMEEEGSSYAVLTNEFAYDGNDRLVLARSPQAVQGGDPFHVTQTAYDERGLPFREIRAPGSPLQATAQYDYDGNGNLRATRSGLEAAQGPRVTEYAYDGLDRRTRVTDPMGNETRFEYDLNGNLVRQTVYGETTDVPGSAGNRRLSDTRYAYDALDRLVTFRPAFFDVFTQAPLGDGFQDNAIAYAPNGLVVATTNDRGHGTTFVFDTTMFLTSVADAANNSAGFSYDANGNVLSVTRTDSSGAGGPDEVFVRTCRYDALDRPVADWDNAGSTNRYAYDSRNNRVRHTDSLGFSLEGDFDSISRPTSNRKGIGGSAQNSTRYAWDAASRLVASTDGNTNTTAYAYDSLDRLVRTLCADGTSVTNVYDVHGNLVWTRDASGTEIVCVYDALGRCVQKSITPGPGVAADTTVEAYQYDGLSRLVLASNNQTVVTRVYDSLGRCIREATESPALAFNPREYTRTLDAHGLLLAQAQPSGRIVEYSYDALGRPVSLGYRASAEDPLRMLEQFAYAGPDRLARVTRANGVQTDYAYSGLAGVPNAPGDFGWGQIQGVRHARDGVPAIAAFTFAHDRNQNKTLRALTEPFVPGGPTNLQAFVYDSLDRLVHAVTATNGATARDTTYVLDPMGNRLSVIRDGADQLYTLDPALPTPGDFQVHQYTETPFDARQYDENGNLGQTVAPSPVGPVTNAFIYDYADRLVAVQGASGPVAAYAYDALGRRIAKIVYAGLPPAPALTNRYLYADGQVIEEEDGGGAVLRTYAMPHVFDQKGRVSVTGGGVVLFHHCDDQGSLLALTDEKGRVVERFDYDDYGAPVFLDPEGLPRAGATASLNGVPYLFHGMLWDDETGLHLAQGRGGGVNDNGCVLDPNTGSTLSRTHAAPHVFETKGRTYADSNPYSLKKEEGGRHTPFHNKYGASRTTDVTGEIVLMDGRSLAMSYAGIGGINGGMPNRISMNVTVAKQTQGATFGEKVNAGLHAAGGALAQGASRAKGTVKFFNDAKGFGRTGGAGTKAQDHNSSRSNKTSSRVDFGGGGSTFDGFPVRYVFPKTRASSGGGDPTELRVRFVVKI